MDFLIKLKPGLLSEKSLVDIQSSQEPVLKITNTRAAFKVLHYVLGDWECYLIGDLVFPQEIETDPALQANYIQQYFKQNKLYQLKGFHYLIVLNHESNSIIIFSCFLNILPVYYNVSGEVITVSGSLSEVYKEMENKPDPNERYIVEKALFNYSFLNSTPFSNIFLMPSCHYITISKAGLSINKYYSPGDLIVEKPIPWKKNLKALSDVYSKELITYVPGQLFALTLTGGFDGRTVLSSALSIKAKFDTFSYGSSGAPDVLLPESISKTIGFPYMPFYLDDNYAKNDFWNDAISFLMRSEGAGNISRGHYICTARELSKKHNYLLTGNFGSELIRSMKDPGVMASEVLFALFDADDKQVFEKFVNSRKQLDFIDPVLREKHLSALIDEAWNYKQSLPQNYSANKKFYMYMFGEVFRKYFGAEIVAQSEFLINRSPFIDFTIFESTLKTSIAGVYQDFKEKRPLKRFHGQILYAFILKKLYPPLLDLMLDKGYKPKNFLSIAGRLSILLGYLKRNYLNKNKNYNPSYSEKFYDFNYDKLESIVEESKYLNKELLKTVLQSGEWKQQQQEFVNALSMELYYQKYLN